MIWLPCLLAFFEPYGIGGCLLSLSVGPTIDSSQSLPSQCWPAGQCPWLPQDRPKWLWGQGEDVANSDPAVCVHSVCVYACVWGGGERSNQGTEHSDTFEECTILWRPVISALSMIQNNSNGSPGSGEREAELDAQGRKSFKSQPHQAQTFTHKGGVIHYSDHPSSRAIHRSGSWTRCPEKRKRNAERPFSPTPPLLVRQAVWLP